MSEINIKLNNGLEALLEGKISQQEIGITESAKDKRSSLDARIYELEHIQRLSKPTIDYVCNFVAKPAKL